MKNTYKIIIGIVFLFLTALSCETDSDASELLDIPQLVVINGYLSPQEETIKIQVSRSKSRAEASSLDPEKLVVNYATVSIKDEQQNEVVLNYNSETFNYEIDASLFPIEDGKQYFLSANVDGEIYSSFCKIPINTVTNIQEEIKIIEDNEYYTDYSFRLDFDDPANFENFYIGGAKRLVTNNGETLELSLFEDITQFTTDNNRDGRTISIESEIYQTLEEGDLLKLQVANVEKVLYDTLRASYLNAYNEDNPFSDPIILPTNIEGKDAYGVFAGFQLTEKEVIYIP